jgi:hypothetical protein
LFENVRRRILNDYIFPIFAFCFSSAENSNCDLTEKNYSIDILIKYMTHELAEIRTAVYCSIAMLVAVSKT